MAHISIIVPVYNIENEISVCIDSLINQDFDDLEIILVDDGSLDSSGMICDQYAYRDNRIKVIHKHNGGLVSARKDGLRASTSEYILYVDGDDWLEIDTCSTLYRYIMNYNADVVLCGHYINVGNRQSEAYNNVSEGFYNKNRLINELYPTMITGNEFYEWKVFPIICGNLWKKESLFDAQMSVDDIITMGEDAACTYPSLLEANSVYILRRCFYHYRQTNNSMVKKIGDCEIERKRLATLNRNVIERLIKYPEKYGLKIQWMRYMMFLMIPRASQLYENYSNLDYLFPFCNVRRNMKIVIYGAGTYGQHLFNYLKRSGFCEVVALADQNYKEICAMGLPVISPDKIIDYDFDAIVIANMFSSSRKEIIEFLKGEGVDSSIGSIDEELIFSDDTLRAFRLEDYDGV